MLSYKQWKMLNESVFPSFNLGIANPSNLGVQSQSGFAMDIEEGKKKMLGDDETGDGEMVEPASEKDNPDVDVSLGDDNGGCGDDEKCGAFSKKSSKKTAKKSSKKKCGADMDEPHSDKQDNDDGGDEDELMFAKKKAKSKMMKAKKTMWSDEDDASGDDDEEDAPKAQDVSDDSADDGDDEGTDDEDMGDDSDDDGDVLNSKFVNKGNDPAMFSKKKSKKSSKKNMQKEATETDEEWWNSVRSMTNSNPDAKFGDGWTEYQTKTEDLFTPVDTENLTQAVRPSGEPQPGDVGFAPQQRLT